MVIVQFNIVAKPSKVTSTTPEAPTKILWKFTLSLEMSSKHLNIILIVCTFSKVALPKKRMLSAYCRRLTSIYYVFPPRCLSRYYLHSLVSSSGRVPPSQHSTKKELRDLLDAITFWPKIPRLDYHSPIPK